LAVFGDPVWDLLRRGELSNDLQEYAVKPGNGIFGLIVGLAFEFRKLKNAD